MNISIKENGIHMDFIVTEEKRLQLIGCSIWDNCNLEENKFAQAVEIQCAGENQNDHHGAKHCYCASSDSLEYISHEITSNSYGKLLKIELTDDKMRVILNYQF